MATKAVREARAAIREIEARIAAHVRAREDKARQTELAKRAFDKFKVPATVQRDGFSVELTTMDKVKPGYVGGTERDKLEAAIFGGDVKVDYGPGTARGVKSLARILRVTSPADTRALARLDRRIEKAQDERDALIAAMHERGTPMTQEALAKHAAKVYGVAQNAFTRLYDDGDWEKKRMETELTHAYQHLAYLEGKAAGVSIIEGGPKVCPCPDCGQKEKERMATERELDRINALPRVMVKACALCGKNHRSPTERRREVRIDKDISYPDGTPAIAAGTYEDFPVAYCAKTGKWLLLASVWQAEAPRREREAARAMKRDGVDWTCQSCGEEQRTIPQEDDYTGSLYVECGICEMGTPLDVANPKALIRLQRAAARKEDAA